MPSKPRRIRADKDDLVWEKLDERIDEWLKSVVTSNVYHAVAHFILKFKPGKAQQMHRAMKGGYNVIYRLAYSDGTSVVMRIPIKGELASCLSARAPFVYSECTSVY